MSLTARLFKMTVFIGMLFLAITACQKGVPVTPLASSLDSGSSSSLHRDTIQTTKKDSTTTKKDTTTTTKKDTVPPTGNIIAVGTGSGTLTIDGTGKTYACGTVMKIKGGSYTNITIKNVKGASGCPVTITNDGQVELKGYGSEMDLSNLNYVTITGNGTSGTSQGFYFHDNTYRAVQFSGVSHNVTIQYALFKNIGDYVISSDFGNTAYNDADSNTYWNGIHFLNLEFNNTGQINLDGGTSGSQVLGVVRNLEIGYCYFHDGSPGDAVFALMADKYYIHHNTVNNFNANNGNDNGIFHMQGNGIFAYNKVTNHEGHAIRAWTVSLGTTPVQTLMYNNIVFNSSKYSAFEVQSFSALLIPGKTTYGNARVFGNTCGDLDLANYWFGQVVDVYGLLGGNCEVFNNLAFNFPNINGGDKFVNAEGPTTLNEHNNLYFSSWQAAGITDNTSFKLNSNSPAKHAGVADPSLTTDYYGTSRSNSPSIGAVE